VLVWTSAGAALAYFCDPELGKGRRARIKDQLTARARRTRRGLARKARYVGSTVEGKLEKVTRSDGAPPADDRTVVDKVKSEVLGRPAFAGHQVLVEAADGVVTLRGELDPSLANELEKAVRAVSGVREVSNLVHPPGEPAPNKEPSLTATS
jgi:osmotically-inducible protein OsmY